MRACACLLFLTLFATQVALSQQKTEALGSVKGIVRDTANNYVLKSATASVYKVSPQDSVLLSYQITNTYGEFNFTNLPLNSPLKLIVNNVGYHVLIKEFSIPADTKAINLKTLVMIERTTSLKEVVISIPPISMNGDTLEFNAAAFKLDSNAVVEDLLRKIPNIVVWGDNTITVNGREIKKLTVNGKDFFGGNFKVATQNLSKNVVDKVQVFRTAISNTLDSTLNMNIKLKKGQEFGYFGKIGAGRGTDGRYETDMSINAFSPKMQLGIVAAINNINKLANNVNTILTNSTFKGVGTAIEYRPDFSMGGITRSKAIGTTFTYNFVEKPTYYERNTLNVNYFFRDRDTENASTAKTITARGNLDKIIDDNINNNFSNTLGHKVDSKYEWTENNHALTVNQSFINDKSQNNIQTLSRSRNEQDLAISEYSGINAIDENRNSYNLSINYLMGQKQGKKFKGLSTTYTLGVDNKEEKRLNQTDFLSFINPLSTQRFNRKYNTDLKDVDQVLNFALNDLKTVFFDWTKFYGFDFSLSNDLKLNHKREGNVIEDFNPATSMYEHNQYLTNNVRTNTTEDAPALIVSKSIKSSLSDRFNKDWTFRLGAKHLFIYQENRSDKAFQNINRSYSQFAPEASINYTNRQWGKYFKYYQLSFNTSIKTPTLQQLAPLIDSTSITNIQQGNLALLASINRNIQISYRHEDQTGKNTLNYNFAFNLNYLHNNIIDSVLISDDNRRNIYPVNDSHANNYLSFNANIRKALKLKTSEFQIGLTTMFGKSKNGAYLNGAYTFSDNLNATIKLNANFTYKDKIALEGAQSYSMYSLKQAAFNTKFNGVLSATTLSSSYRVTKKITLNSDITFNRNTSTNTDAINFTLWNASANFRFLKGNNLELKFSALDLLRQNSSIINDGSSTNFTVGTRNVLTQYFMTTVSYYPRHFGKKTKR
ncbi:outer membrane beta-barrel protein [Pedobacter insulae]|uniref:Outer membrane protein beta-barrel family protein n=1 Tax=Pedobacter insulae TaxID=414048 RepID=A0A1I2USX6_9SPHI|nr:outer membrane beta-barrel protein [Pedobacter insulae]SFG80118.1 Outer membrane protein beta-barrel family protein [Pedobacter insulae]